MSCIAGMDRRVGLVRSSAWGTETEVTKLVELTNFNPTETVAVNPARDQFRTTQTTPFYGGITADVSISGRCTYDSTWLDILWGVARWEDGGTASNPTETTASEGDYAHSQAIGTGKGCYHTMAWYLDSDTIQTCNVQFNSITISANVNEAWTFSASGIADYITTASVNDTTILDALTRPEYEEIIWAGSAANVQVGNYNSALGALECTAFSYSLSWPGEVRDYHLNTVSPGATPRTNTPRRVGRAEQSLSLTLGSISNNSYDYFAKYLSEDLSQGVKINAAGRQIGAGVNRSFAINIPRAHWAGPSPQGLAIQEDTIFFPQLELTPVTGPSTPLGFSGPTTYFSFVNTTSTGYSN